MFFVGLIIGFIAAVIICACAQVGIENDAVKRGNIKLNGNTYKLVETEKEEE